MDKIQRIIRESIRYTLFAILLAVSGYSLTLTGAWLVNLYTWDKSSKFAEDIVEQHLQKYEVAYRANWAQDTKNPGVTSLKFAQQLTKDKAKEKARLLVEVKKLGFVRDTTKLTTEGIVLEKEFDSLRLNKIFSLLKQKDQSFWWLLNKGFLLNILSLVILIFVAGNKSQLAEYDFRSDRDLYEVENDVIVTTLAPLFIFLAYQVFMMVNLGWNGDASILAIFLTIICVIISFFVRLYFIIPVAAAVQQTISALISLSAYYWLNANKDEGILSRPILNDLNNKGPFFLIHEKGAQIVKIKKDTERLLPTYRKNESNNISLDHFYHLLNKDAKTEAFKDLRVKLMKKFHGYFKASGEAEVASYMEKIGGVIKAGIKTELVKQKLNGQGDQDSLTEQEMINLTHKSLKLFRQKLVDSSQEKLTEVTGQLQQVLFDEISKSELGRQLKEGSYTSLRLPNQTKFFLTQGNITLFVIEQPPQMRTIYYYQKRFHLAFPYTIFIPIFKDNNFCKLFFFYTNQPLQTLSDPVFLPNINNINTDGSVCMGSKSISAIGNNQGSLGEKAELAIACFWQAQFNNDLDSNFSRYAKKYGKLKGYEAWEEHSKKDPLFPLKIKWLEVGELIDEINSAVMENGGTNEDDGIERIKTQIDSWFSDHGSILREQILRVWSGLDLEPFSQTTVRELRNQREAEIEKIFEQIKKIFSREVSSKKIEKKFLKTINDSLMEAVKKDFADLALTVPLKRQISFTDLIQQDL